MVNNINSYNWYYKMIGLNKKRKMYLSPRTSSAEVDLEGIICGSPTFNLRVHPLINDNEGFATAEEDASHYFES